MPVDIPLDKICVKTGVLCPRCQRIMDSGIYNDLDLEVMRALISIESRIKPNIKYLKSYLFNDKLVILVKSNRGELPADLGKLVEAALDNPRIKKVIIMPTDEDPKSLLEYIIRPYKVIDMTRSYLPDGSEAVTIKIPREAAVKLVGEISDLVRRYLEEKLNAHVYFDFVDISKQEGESFRVSKPDLRRLLRDL